MDKGKRFELGYCPLRLQETLICDTQKGYCNSTPRALVAHTPWAGDRVKHSQRITPGGILSALLTVTPVVSVR